MARIAMLREERIVFTGTRVSSFFALKRQRDVNIYLRIKVLVWKLQESTCTQRV